MLIYNVLVLSPKMTVCTPLQQSSARDISLPIKVLTVRTIHSLISYTTKSCNWKFNLLPAQVNTRLQQIISMKFSTAIFLTLKWTNMNVNKQRNYNKRGDWISLDFTGTQKKGATLKGLEKRGHIEGLTPTSNTTDLSMESYLYATEDPTQTTKTRGKYKITQHF